MKFKVLKGTALYDKLYAVKEKIHQCNKAALELAESIGVESIRLGNFSLGGGISAFKFDKKPDGWKYAYSNKEKGAYMPSKIKKNEELLNKIAALPIVKDTELNKLVGYDWGKHCPTKHIMLHPGLEIKSEYALLSFSDNASLYTPVDDMIEITVSEYNSLAK